MSQVLKPKKGYKSVPWLFGKEIEIPEEWEVKKLNEITNKIGDGIHSTPEYVEHSEYYFINGNNLINGKITYFENTKNVSKEEFLKYELKLNENTILLSINGTIGNVAFYNKEKIILGKSASYIICNDKLNTLFLFYQLQSNLTKKYFSTQLTGTTISNLSLSSIRNMIFHLPLFPEQQKIASILSNINNLIESTRQVIENSKSLKTGLMQKLLTRGISHTKFKKVPWLFGKEIEIPEEWEVKELETLVDILDSKRIPLEVSERKKRIGKYPYYGASGIIDYVNDYIFDERILCLSEDGENLKSRVLPIAFTVEEKCWVNNHAHVLKMKKNVEHYFIEKVLNHISLLKYVASTAIPKLNQRDMCTIPILLPPLPEQQKIASILSNIDAQIDSQTQYKDKLERLKKSLMQKLLTGEVRV